MVSSMTNFWTCYLLQTTSIGPQPRYSVCVCVCVCVCVSSHVMSIAVWWGVIGARVMAVPSEVVHWAVIWQGLSTSQCCELVLTLWVNALHVYTQMGYRMEVTGVREFAGKLKVGLYNVGLWLVVFAAGMFCQLSSEPLCCVRRSPPVGYTHAH